MRRKANVFLPIAGVAIASMPHSASAGGEFACGNALAVIVDGTPEENVLACDGVARAANLFSECGMPPVEAVRVAVVPSMLEVCGVPAHGSYVLGSGEIRIASLAACKSAARDDRLFGIIPAPEAWRSIVVHESAHAAIMAFGMPVDRLVPHEFVAAVVQLASLPVDARAGFLIAKPVSVPVEESDLTAQSWHW